MTTHVRHWWGAAGDEDELVAIEPIPFPSRRARMTIKPPHAQNVGEENRLAAANAQLTLVVLEQNCRRIDVLARELDCLWFYDEYAADDESDPPSAA